MHDDRIKALKDAQQEAIQRRDQLNRDIFVIAGRIAELERLERLAEEEPDGG